MLPESVLKNIPPRPIGYTRSREVIKTRTDLTFDALGAAESAADNTIGLLLHPARATRLVEYNARDKQQPSLGYVLDQILAETIKSPAKDGYDGAIQITVNNVVLNSLFKLTLAKEASLQARATASLKINQLKLWLQTRAKATSSEMWKAHYDHALIRIDAFLDNPEDYQFENTLAPPPGQPIGSDYTCGEN